MRSLWVLLFSLLWLTPALGDAPPPKTTKQALARLMDGAKRTHSDTLLVMRNGKVLAEWHTGNAPEPIELMSVTKSVVALAVGVLVRDGKLASLDEPVCTFFPEWKQGRKQNITVRMLMNHTSGLQNVANAGVEIYPAKDFLQLALAAELDADPGSKSSYNNKALNLLTAVIGKAAGMPIDEFLQRSLFDVMTIKPGEWSRDDAGNRHGMSGLPMTAADLAKLGQLVLDQGRWQGQQLLPAEFVQQMLAPQPLSPGYGLLWWRKPAWVDLQVSAKSLSRLREGGASDDFVSGVAKLQGQHFSNQDALLTALIAAVDAKDVNTLLEREFRAHKLKFSEVFELSSGGPTLLAGEGYLGQHLVVAPGTGIVAVRQIAYKEGLTPEDGYSDFPQDVALLAATFDASYRRP
jgi:CubicO group peptidase (beta-lactamase class C family)